MSRSGSTGPNAEEKMVISLSEFTALQTQMLELKQARYEAIEREKKLSKELETLKAQAKHTEEQLKKAADQINKARESRIENENLKKALEQLRAEAQQNQGIMKQNLRELFEANADLQSQLAALRAENEQLQRQASARPATPSEPALAPSLVSATEPPPAATSSAADGASDAEERLRVMQAEADRDRQALLARLSERELQLDRLRDQVAAVPALQRELQASREQLAAAEARLQALQRDAAATREQLAATEARLQTLQRDSQSAREQLEARLQSLQSELEAAREQLSAANAALEAQRREAEGARAAAEEHLAKLREEMEKQARDAEAQLAAARAEGEAKLAAALEEATAREKAAKEAAEEGIRLAVAEAQAARAAADALRADLEAAAKARAELEARLAAAREEAELALKIAEKKSARLLKELQDQLQRERQQRAAANSGGNHHHHVGPASPSPAPGSPAMQRTGSAGELRPGNGSSGASSGLARGGSNSALEGSRPSRARKSEGSAIPSAEQLLAENNHLAVRLGQLQSEKTDLEQRCRALQEKLSRAASHASEEAALRAKQLQQDLRTLADEVERLTQENKALRARAALS